MPKHSVLTQIIALLQFAQLLENKVTRLLASETRTW